MNIVDGVVDVLNKIPLFEMAYARKKAIEYVGTNDTNIASHLVYVLLSGDRSPVTHWLGEIDAWLRHVDTHPLLKNNKRLDVDTLYECLFVGPLGSFQQLEDYVEYGRRAKGLMLKDPIPETYEQLDKLIMKICVDLHHKQFFGIKNYL